MIRLHPDTKALLVTIGFTLALLGALAQGINDWGLSLPLIVFYVVLLINTFFSIRCFARITPEGQIVQDIVDVFLVILYLFLAFSMNDALLFIFFSLLLFIMATIKYILLLGQTHHTALVKRKVFVDALGTLACGVMLGALLYGYSTGALWVWSVAFVLANIYLFFVKPLYTIPK